MTVCARLLIKLAAAAAPRVQGVTITGWVQASTLEAFLSLLVITVGCFTSLLYTFSDRQGVAARSISGESDLWKNLLKAVDDLKFGLK